MFEKSNNRKSGFVKKKLKENKNKAVITATGGNKMKKYLFLNDTLKKGIIKTVGEDFFESDWRRELFPEDSKNDFTWAFKLSENDYFDFWLDGVLCIEDGYNINGVQFMLVIPDDQKITKEVVKLVKRKIKQERDVTGFREYKIDLKED